MVITTSHDVLPNMNHEESCWCFHNQYIARYQQRSPKIKFDNDIKYENVLPNRWLEVRRLTKSFGFVFYCPPTRWSLLILILDCYMLNSTTAGPQPTIFGLKKWIKIQVWHQHLAKFIENEHALSHEMREKPVWSIINFCLLQDLPLQQIHTKSRE